MSIDIRAYLDLEQALLKRLLKTWEPLAADLFSPIQDAIKAKDWAKARILAGEINAASIVENNRQYIKYMLLATANFGALMANPKDSTVLSEGNFGGFLDRIVQSFVLMAEHSLNADLYEKALHLIAEAQQAATEKAEVQKDYVDGDPNKLLAPADRYVKDFVSFQDAGIKGVKMLSMLHSSRMAVWGFTAEADALGYETYRLTAVLDNRTSKFCRYVANGKVFRVQQAKDLINSAMSAQTADEIKSIQPWPKQDKASIEEYMAMTADELAELGLATPPFHPFCRTLLTRVDDQPNLGQVEIPPEEETTDYPPVLYTPPAQPQGEPPQAAPDQQGFQFFQPATVQDFAELGLDVSQKEVDFWNSYVGKDPVEILAGLSTFKPLDLLDSAEEAGTKPVEFTKNGNIKFQFQGDIGEAEDMGIANVNLVYDPFDGSLTQNYAEVTDADAGTAATYLRDYYQGLVDTGQEMDVSEIVMRAGGGNELYTFTTMGLLPSDSDWYNLKQDITNDLADGNPLSYVRDKLDPDAFQTVIDLLGTSDPGAIEALAQLPYDVDGVPIGQLLLEGRSLEVALDMRDPTQVEKFRG